jgi:small subunit ribosomal protein S1
LDFKVIEFSKDNKKIVLSHTRLHDEAVAAERESANETRKQEEETTKKTVKKMKDSLEKTTLGDIQALSDLKSEMDAKDREKK